MFRTGLLRDEAPDSGGGGGAAAPPVDGAPPDADMTALRSSVERMQQTIQRQNDVINQFTSRQPVAQPATPPPQPAGVGKDEVEKTFWKNPLDVSAAIAQKVAQDTMGGFMRQNFETMVESAKMMALQNPEFRKIYERYTVDVEGKVASVDPQFRTNPNTWKNAIVMVRGEKMDEIVRERGAQAPSARVGDGPAPPNHRAAPAVPSPKLSEAELAMAKNLKLSEEQYLQGKARYNDQDTSWAKVITFDSQEKRNADRVAATRNKK